MHQFVHIGAHAFTGMGTYLPQDLPPYVTAAGNMAQPYGINSEGLKRRGFSPEAIAALKRAYKTLYRRGLGLEEARRELEAQAAECPEVRRLSISSAAASAASSGSASGPAARRHGGRRGVGRPARRAAHRARCKARRSRCCSPASAGRAWWREGFESHYPMEKLSVRGYAEVLRHYREIIGDPPRASRSALLAERPDLFIGVDASDFNLGLERKLKDAGIPTIHYVSPSVWAWRGWRVRSDRALGDRILVMFPFEAAALREGRRAGDLRRPSARRRDPARAERSTRRAPRCACRRAS